MKAKGIQIRKQRLRQRQNAKVTGDMKRRQIEG